MSTQSRLAIVIPAYKGKYLKQTLQSLADQTCKDFIVYIGDDKSPDDLFKIVEEFEGRIDIVYKKFENNLGGVNLVDQWNRCINLIDQEQWIWLFSDDDYVESICVETFYSSLNKNKDIDLYRFNNQIVNSGGEAIGPLNKFPEFLSAEDFFKGRLNKKIYSYAVEYIFSRQAFEDVKGFEYFDLCWSTDDATWIKLARKHGIYTMNQGIVYWRYSDLNISSITNDKPIVIRKIQANLAYLLWADRYFKSYIAKFKIKAREKLKWLLTMPIETTCLNIREKEDYIVSSLQSLNLENRKSMAYFIFYSGLLKKAIKSFFIVK